MAAFAFGVLRKPRFMAGGEERSIKKKSEMKNVETKQLEAQATKLGSQFTYYKQKEPRMAFTHV